MGSSRRRIAILAGGVGLLFAGGVYLGITVSWVVGSAPIGIAVILGIPLVLLLLRTQDHPQ